MDVKCPSCGRWLNEMGKVPGAFGRSVCGQCSVVVAVTVRGKGEAGVDKK